MVQDCLYVRGVKVLASDIKTAVTDLCIWLEHYKDAFLVAHNGRRFDFPVLLTALKNTDKITDFFECVTGFVDSLPVFRKRYPGDCSYKLDDLVTKHLKETYAAHDASADVTVLAKLLGQCETSDIMKHAFSPNAVHHLLLFNEQKHKHVKTLHVLIAEGIIKMSTAERIAGSGLNLQNLNKIAERSGEDGLYEVFTATNSDGQPRVSNQRKLLEEIIPKLAAFCDKRVHV